MKNPFYAISALIMLLISCNANAEEQNSTSYPHQILPLLFAEMPIEVWADGEAPTEPWLSFVKAKSLIARGQNLAAIEALNDIIKMDSLESLHYLQASRFLRQLGVKDESPLLLYGVIVEVSLKAAGIYDLLAVYSDRSVQYFNHGGSLTVWGHPDASLDKEIKALLDEGHYLLPKAGNIWEGPRPVPLKKDMVRMNLLTSNGTYIIEADAEGIEAHPCDGLMTAATWFLMALFEK